MIDLDAKKAALDELLKGANPNVGVAFGYDLYCEFAKRGWLTKEVFSIGGTGAFEQTVPAYARSHYASMDWALPPEDFKVGA